MRTLIQITSRSRLIEFGHALAAILQEADAGKQWVIHIGGDSNSGKSLIALAIDQALNPERYPNGIPQLLLADIKLEADNHGTIQTVFKNFLWIKARDKKMFDGWLKKYKEQNRDAKVLVAANIKRITARGEFNYAKNGLDSEVLDVGIEVYKSGYGFKRTVGVTVDNESLRGGIQALASAEVLHRAQKIDASMPSPTVPRANPRLPGRQMLRK